MKTLALGFRKLLDHPVRVAIVASFMAFGGLLLEGTLLNLWDLHREKSRLENRYKETVQTNKELLRKIDQAKSSDRFIARQALDRLDMIGENELVFIFENDEK